MRTIRISGLALTLLACGDDDGYAFPATCQLDCEQAARCEGTSASRCAMGCVDPAPPAPKLSPRYLDAVRHCLDAQGCNVLLGSAADTCAASEALRFAPSKLAMDLCRRANDDAYTCGPTLAPATCLDDVKLYDDPSLRRALACYDGPCAQRGACLRDWFGGYAGGYY